MRFTEIISEAGSPAQQAAKAIAMKKAGKKPKNVSENDTAAGINKMFNNLGDPVFSNLQRVALLAMQGRQQEASGRLQSVIKDASPAVQKKIIDAVNSIKPVTINGKIADSSTIDKSKQHRDWIINTFIPWVQSLLGQQGVAEGNLKEFAPGNGGGESGRWYTDDEMTDIVGDGWWQDMDVSGANIGVIDSEVPKEYMIQQAQAWLDDQGYSVQVLNCKVNDDDMEWYIEGSFNNDNFAKKGVAEGLNEFAPYDHNKGDDDDDNNGDRKKIEKMFYEVKIGEEFQLVKHYETFGVKIDDHTAHFYEEDMGEVGEDYGIERVSWDEPVRADWYFMEGENWSKHNNKRVGGMSKKSVSSYRRSHPGSKIQTAVTTKPSKLKKGSKAAARRKSFCARMRGMKKHRTGAKTANDPNSNINKSLRRWHCESIEELHELVMLAEQYIRNNKK